MGYRRKRWAYGVTTIPRRRNDYLRTTLRSLREAGFDRPWLFVDGEKDSESWKQQFGLEVTVRYPNIGPYGNWILSLSEMMIRNPACHYYAIFQDDFVTYRNLREYLDQVQYPEKGYLNLYTFPENEELCPFDKSEITNGVGDCHKRVGWFESNQKGKGAVALVFSREGVCTLLQQQTIIKKPLDVNRPKSSIDGAVVTGMTLARWKEYCHYPSLVQHIGDSSSIGAFKHPKSNCFLGEGYNAMELLGRVRVGVG